MSGAGALGAALVAGFLRVPPLWGVPVALALLVGLLICINPPRAVRVEHVLLARWTPFAIGVASSLVMLYAWGSLQQMPLRQDERAYVLQAELFAAGRWTDPPPPILQFFEQPHVLVTPALASEYPPGNSLILTPGVWLHAPGLIPVLLLGLSGGLVFGLTRRVVRGGLGPWVAVLAWIGWIGLTGSKEWPRPFLRVGHHDVRPVARGMVGSLAVARAARAGLARSIGGRHRVGSDYAPADHAGVCHPNRNTRHHHGGAQAFSGASSGTLPRWARWCWL